MPPSESRGETAERHVRRYYLRLSQDRSWGVAGLGFPTAIGATTHAIGNRLEWVNSIKQIPDDDTYVPEVYDPAEPTSWNVWGVMPPPHFLRRIGPGSRAAV